MALFCSLSVRSLSPVVPAPTQTFKDWKCSGVIWANHNLRACVSAMQQTSAQIFKDQSLINVEPKVVSVKEVFRLQDQPELDAAEKIYLPQKKA